MTKQFENYWYKSNDGLDLYARIYNPSVDQAILCMHGLTRNSSDFENVADHLSEKYRVIVVEQRGRANSQWDKNYENYNPKTYVQDMYSLLDSLNIEKVALIGTSLGGLMSMLMRAMTPERILGVVLNDIGPELDVAGLDRIKAYVGKSPKFKSFEELAQKTKQIHGDFFPKYSDQNWLEMAKRTAVLDDSGAIKMNYDPAISKPFNEANDNAVPQNLWPLFEAMKGIELLTVRGELSDLFSNETMQRMADVHGDMTSHIVPDEGHAPMMDDPDTLRAIDLWASKIFK